MNKAGKEADQIRGLLEQDSSFSNGDIARIIRNEFGSKLALSTLVKLAQSQRTLAMHDPRSLAASYGRMVIVDVCNVDLLIGADQQSIVPACNFVVERSSGLILAAVLAHPLEALEAQGEALRDAFSQLAEKRLDCQLADGGPSSVRLTLPPLRPEDVEPAKLESLLREQNLDIEIGGKSKRRFGERLRSNIGSNIGRLRLLGHWHVDEAPTMTRRRGRLLTWPQAMQFVAMEVSHHNEAVLGALGEAGLHKDFGTDVGAMSLALNQISSAWPYAR
jgi:hypothetical protein